MLELLRIHNLALIEDLSIEFASGMNVLTGETGAGKSFILKALNFLTGDKLGTDLVRPGASKAVVEALFFLDGEEQILRRELTAESGRSRLYLNDRLCAQDVVHALRPRLILHTSQHGQQKLLQASYQAAILDDFMDRPELLEARNRVSKSLNELAQRIQALEQTRLSLEDKRDVLEYQQQQIEAVHPRAGEEEELEAKRASARNQASIADNAEKALAALHGHEDGPGILKELASLERVLTPLAAILDDFASTPDVLAQMRQDLLEIDSGLRRAVQRATKGADLEAIESRLYALAQLKRKLKRSLESILALQEEIRQNLDFLDSCALDHTRLLKDRDALLAQLTDVLNELNPARKRAAEELSAALQEELKGLGFSEHVRVLFEFDPHRLHNDSSSVNGTATLPPGDQAHLKYVEYRARLFWQPNPGQPPQPLDRIASGGELSRFLLALTSLMSKKSQETPTLIFDEVDAGVGGLTLNRVGESLAKLAEQRQMLLITHWPQLAARAARHFMVQKEVIDGQTFTRCQQLDADAVQRELARMAGDPQE